MIYFAPTTEVLSPQNTNNPEPIMEKDPVVEHIRSLDRSVAAIIVWINYICIAAGSIIFFVTVFFELNKNWWSRFQKILISFGGIWLICNITGSRILGPKSGTIRYIPLPMMRNM